VQGLCSLTGTADPKMGLLGSQLAERRSEAKENKERANARMRAKRDKKKSIHVYKMGDLTGVLLPRKRASGAVEPRNVPGVIIEVMENHRYRVRYACNGALKDSGPCVRSTLYGIVKELRGAGELTSALQASLHADVLDLLSKPTKDVTRLSLDELRDKVVARKSKGSRAMSDDEVEANMVDDTPQVCAGHL
jgi:hypothetical protein